ncbi:hypothetical protein GCM10022215_29540 [Nocardioides fonticola]|uniref:Uncharacterized protein n=1 Tax=Nocardioides fonticola TaxID=450363 RepID=A0ABP7XRJ3_9ACTN
MTAGHTLGRDLFASTAIASRQVVLAPHLRDGTVAVTPTAWLIGTAPIPDIEFAGLRARHLVRQGMADILAWLGEDVGPPPIQSGRGQELLDRLHAAAGAP